MADNKIAQPAEISLENIIRPAFDELSAEHRQAFEDMKKQREEEFKALREKQEAEDLKAYLASFKKDRQGVIAPVKELKLPPMVINSDKPSVSTELFSSEQIAAIQHYVSEGTTHVYDLITEHEKAKKNTPPIQSSVNQPMSRNPDNQLMAVPPYVVPI